MTLALLDQECRLTRTAAGVYERDLGQVWWGHGAQHGGYVTALAITAVAAEIDAPEQSPHQLTIQFMRPFVDGPFRAEVCVERRGRTMTNATARLWSGGKPAGLVLASFATWRPEGEIAALRMPAVAPPGPDEEPEHPGVAVATFDLVAMYPRFGGLLQPVKPGDSSGTGGNGAARIGGWAVPHTPEIIDDRYLAFLADFWIPAAYGWLPRGTFVQSVDITYHSRGRFPRADLPPGAPLLVDVTTKASVGGLVDEDVEIWSRDGELLAQTRQARFVHAAR